MLSHGGSAVVLPFEMSSSDPAPAHGLRPADLVEHGAAIRALLRTMVREQDIDDLLQETWLRAMTTRSVRHGRLRAWLEGIARNLARDLGRRRVREARGKPGRPREDAPPAAEVVAELEALRELGGAVEHLAEPYRSAIVLRFFRGWSYDAIAEHTGATPANVRQRLRRGLEQLRARVDRRGRERLLALLPALPSLRDAPPPPPTAAAVGGVRRLLSALALLGIGGLVWGAVELAGAAGPGGAVRQVQLPEAAAVADPIAAAERTGPEPGLRREADAAVAAVAAGVEAQGRTLDASGRPVAGVELVAWTMGASPRPDRSRPLGTSDQEGRFTVTVPKRGLLVGTAEAAALWRGAVLRHDASSRDHVVLVATPIEVAGRVVNEDGTAAPGAELRLGREPLRAFPQRLDGMFAPDDVVIPLDENGGFELRVPSGAGAVLEARAGEASARLEVPEAPRRDLRLQLEVPGMSFTVHGVVRGPGGMAIEGATVGVVGHSWQCTSDASGRYRFEIASYRAPRKATALYAVAPGLAPGIAKSFTGNFWLASGSMAFRHDFDLTAPLPALHGRVLDRNGAPLAGVRVRPWDATPRTGSDSGSVEGVAAGGDGDAVAVTDDDGQFAVHGLAMRGYRLVCTLPGESWPLVTRQDWRPGGHAEVRYSDVDALRTVTGLVRDERGRPLEGVRVAAVVEMRRSRHAEDEARRALVGTTQSDTLGHFELAGIPREAVHLVLDRAGHLPLEVLPAETRVDHHPDLVLPAIAGLRGEDLPAEARWFQLLDESDSRCSVTSADLGSRAPRDTWPVTDGRFEVVDVAPGRRTVQLLDQRHREFARLQVVLRAGEVAVVRGLR